jgi:hypothetical protein
LHVASDSAKPPASEDRDHETVDKACTSTAVAHVRWPSDRPLNSSSLLLLLLLLLLLWLRVVDDPAGQ